MIVITLAFITIIAIYAKFLLTSVFVFAIVAMVAIVAFRPSNLFPFDQAKRFRSVILSHISALKNQ